MVYGIRTGSEKGDNQYCALFHFENINYLNFVLEISKTKTPHKKKPITLDHSKKKYDLDFFFEL